MIIFSLKGYWAIDPWPLRAEGLIVLVSIQPTFGKGNENINTNTVILINLFENLPCKPTRNGEISNKNYQSWKYGIEYCYINQGL